MIKDFPSKYSTFNFFAKNIIPPFFNVFRVLKDPGHKENKILLEDISSKLDEHKYKLFVTENFNQLNCRYPHEIEKRAFFFAQELQNEIFTIQIGQLLQSGIKSSPYDSENITGIDIDKNNLVPINFFDSMKGHLQYKNYIYEICPTLYQPNSSYWLYRTILGYFKKDDLLFKIRLNPFIEIPWNNYSPMEYKMFIHGKKLDWERINNLKVKEYGRFTDTIGFNDHKKTEYVWDPDEDEVHLTFEELPNPDKDEIKVSRYFHAIFNKRTSGIKHCDGAIRVYSDDELFERSECHIKDTDARKTGKRLKIFQFESKESNNLEIEKDAFIQLVKSFFVWNYDVDMYFANL
jgi:hypothetical protein